MGRSTGSRSSPSCWPDNPLGDSPRRPLYVYRSPGLVSGKTSGPVPSVYVIQGFTGQVDMWLSAHAV